jgi:hypothetical protein
LNQIGRKSTAINGTLREAASSHAAGDHRPRAAAQVLHHEDRERADRDADPENVGNQVRLPERFWSGEVPGDGRDNADTGDRPWRARSSG